MTNIFSVSNKTTKLSNLLFSAAFSIIAAASADASRLDSDDTRFTTSRGVDYIKTEKKLNLRSTSKPAWERERIAKKRKESVLEAPKVSDTDLSEDAPVEHSAKRACRKDIRDQNEAQASIPSVNIEAIDEALEESESKGQRFDGSNNDIRIDSIESMEVLFEENIAPEFQQTPTLFVDEGIAHGTKGPTYDFGVDSFKRSVRKHATKRNLAIAGGFGVVGSLALADYFFTGGVATTTVANFVPNVTQTVTSFGPSIAQNMSNFCPAPTFVPSFVQTVVPEVVSNITTFVPSFAQTVTPQIVSNVSSFAPSFAQTVAPVVANNSLIPYVAPFVPSFAPTFVDTVMQTADPVITTVAPEATRSIFWGFSNMVFGPHQ